MRKVFVLQKPRQRIFRQSVGKLREPPICCRLVVCHAAVVIAVVLAKCGKCFGCGILFILSARAGPLCSRLRFSCLPSLPTARKNSYVADVGGDEWRIA